MVELLRVRRKDEEKERTTVKESERRRKKERERGRENERGKQDVDLAYERARGSGRRQGPVYNACSVE